ncbi:ROK family transcriptional regulator [Alkalihalophilus lindianensis]|uniref:ROK family transcriptional regulator n=1 Tax=Alkalihalophilus lindianensis TaxID=1630542 RepID=A0ABU3XAD6_9BACI|nr:ROK family transcriptional regulator [Alkalihalophilus lindianensis]MDV2684273.1 ROK family transcriptional regulator [Alkalihalophilus lindianensis]
MKIKNQDFLKKENHHLVLSLILNEGPISRANIAKQTDMSPTSASRIVASLLEMDLIKEINTTNRGVGRKANYFIPNENAVFSFGVEIDKELIRIGVMNFVGELLMQKSYKHENRDPMKTIHFIGEEIKQIIEVKSLEESRIAGICIGLPGVISHDLGYVELSAQLEWKNINLSSLLQERVNLPVYADNELKLKALSEYSQIADPTIDSMVMLGFGSGVGSALINKGEIFRGKANFSGEIGHTIVDPFGVYCPCGNFGCLQTYIAESFLLAEASKKKKLMSIQELVDEAENGESWAENILNKAVTYTAVTINNIVCTFNPDVVVLAGSLVENYNPIKERILDKYKSMVWPTAKGTFEMRITETGSLGVVMGAAKSVQNKFIKDIDLIGELSK